MLLKKAQAGSEAQSEVGVLILHGGNISINNGDYDVTRKRVGNATLVFNKVLYIILQISKKYNLEYIMFDSADEALGFIYKKIATNRNFKLELLNYGYIYLDNIQGKFVFTKV